MNKLKDIAENNKLVKILFKIIKGFLVILMLAFIITVYLQRFSNNKVSFFNYRMFTVATSSMEPRYVIGDVLFAKKVEPSEIKVGDAISYEGRVGSFKDKIITHEVVKIVKDNNGKYVFHAKGRANIVEDPIVYEDQLYGIVVYKSRILSFVYKIIKTTTGFFLFIIIPLVGIIGYELISTLLAKEDKRRKSI
ncbi:MAG: signal peptidase I [Mollicutes bacterium]|nr:signal peptidase I [Mollicutes bacterium]